MSSSHRGSRAPIGRIQLILRLSLVLAIALLSIPFLGAVAKADEGTPPVDPAATTAADPATDARDRGPGTADPATTDPGTTAAGRRRSRPSEPRPADPATEGPCHRGTGTAAAPTKNDPDRVLEHADPGHRATATGTCPPYTGGGKVLGFDQNTAEDERQPGSTAP